MHSLVSVTDPEPVRGEFDPANTKEVDRLIRAATIHYGERLALLPRSQREEVLEGARFGAIEAALSYDPATAKTTKWKTAANRANTIVRRFFRELPRLPQTETDVFERVRRVGRGGGDADPEGDAGELDLTVLAADDDDDYDDFDEYDGLSAEEYDALVREDEELLATSGATENEPVEVEPTEDELNPLVRAVDEDAEHFEMRRLLLAKANEPDRTVLRFWTLPATDVGQMIGMSGDAVRQRKTRLRRLISAEIQRPDAPPAPEADASDAT
jgi:hypothetical protein